MKRIGILLTSTLLVAACQQTPFPMEPLQLAPVTTPPPVQAQSIPAQGSQAQGYGFATTKTPLPVTNTTLSPPDVVGELQTTAAADLGFAADDAAGSADASWDKTEMAGEVYNRKLGPGELRIVFNTGPISYKALEDLQYMMPSYVPYPVYVPEYVSPPAIIIQPGYGSYYGSYYGSNYGYGGGSYRGWNTRPVGGYGYGRGGYGGSRFQGSQGPARVYPLPASSLTPSIPVPPGTVAPMVGGVNPLAGGVTPFVGGVTPYAGGVTPYNASDSLPMSAGPIYRSSSPAYGSGSLVGGWGGAVGGGGPIYPGAPRPTPYLVPMAPQGGLSRSGQRLQTPQFGPSATPMPRMMPGVAPFMPPGTPSLASPPGVVSPFAQ